MKKIKILFVALSKVHGDYEPLGVECLAGHLEKIFGSAVESKIVRVRTVQEAAMLGELIKERQPSILALSLFFDTLDLVAVVMSQLNRLRKGPFVIFGNVLAGPNTELLLGKYPKAVVAFGNGEFAIQMLVKSLLGRKKICAVPNIAFLKNGEICRTVTEPSPMGTPLRFFLKQTKRNPQGKIYLEASRGCPNQCDFCSQSSSRVEKSRRQLYEEITVLAKSYGGIIQLDFVDDDLFAVPETALRVASVVLQLKREGRLRQEVKIMCSLSVRSLLAINAMTALKALKDAGLDKCFIGIESFSSPQLKRLGKRHSSEEAVTALRLLDKKGIDYDVGFIMTEPETSLDDLLANCHGIRATRSEVAISNPLHQWRALAGTTMCQRLIVDGLVTEHYDPNWLTYDWAYADQRVAEIIRHAKDLESGLALVGAVIKRICRSEEWYQLPTDSMRYIRQCKKDINLLFLDFLEMAADKQKKGEAINKPRDEYAKKAIDFLSQLIDNRGGGVMELYNAAQQALAIKKFSHRHLLLPQDEPKDFIRGS